MKVVSSRRSRGDGGSAGSSRVECGMASAKAVRIAVLEFKRLY